MSLSGRVRAFGAMTVLLAASLGLLVAPPAGATTFDDVDTEAEWANAIVTASAVEPNIINITGSFSVTTTPGLYSGAGQPLTINGNGFTLDGESTATFMRSNGSGLLTVNDITFTNGQTAGGQSGGAFFWSGDVQISSSSFIGNASTIAGGAVFSNDTVTAVDSTFSGNATDVLGGVAQGSSIVLVNSTLTGNSAPTGGALWVGGGAVDLTYVTMVGNTAATGANISAGTLTSFGSVIALPQGGGGSCDLTGATTSTYSYDDDGTCGLAGTGDTSDGADPALLALADNGGPTQTRAPSEASPLIDAIAVADCDPAVTTDQRGITRPQRDGCDIGAVELEAVVVPPTPPTPPTSLPPGSAPADASGPIAATPGFTG